MNLSPRSFRPTRIFQTTRGGSRRVLALLNQQGQWRKGEPKRRRGRPGPALRKVEPDTKNAFTKIAVTDASLLLVILHYLLKNNTQFIGWNVQGRVGILDLLSTCKFTFGGAQPW